jgi:hypothetical protein
MKFFTLFITSFLLLFILLLTPLNAGLFDDVKGLFNTGKSGASLAGLSDSDVAAGLKDALGVASSKVVSQLSAPGGFNTDPAVRIPLPDSLQAIQKTMSKFGLGSYMDDLQLKLNEAAELATDKAKPIFVDAIKEMTWDDAKSILSGADDSATQYFRDKTSADIASEMKPIVEQSLSQVGAINSYNQLIDKYKALPLVPDVKANLTDHVLDKGTDGIFHYMAIEEAKIRNNPAARTTDLLKKVFTKN